MPVDWLISYYNLERFCYLNKKRDGPRPKSMQTKPPPPENPLLNILINILLPVVVLNKGSQYFDPKLTLVLALAFPLVYGIQDYIRRKHKNYVSLLGILNILLTGGLALMKLQGIWFAVKEASLPLALGLMVLASYWSKNPAARMIFCNPQVMKIDLIEARLREFNRDQQFHALLKRTTLWLSFSFFISAVLNFAIAYHIFVDIDAGLEPLAREQVLNEQIARMTWMGFAVIAAPLMIFSGILVMTFLKRVSVLTDTPVNNLLNS